MAAPKIAVYSLPDLKNTTDDALPNYLNSLKFKQQHFLTDVRLAVGYAAVIIAAITFYLDHRFGWDKTKAFTFWAVIAYFTLNSGLQAWIWYADKGNIFVGSSENTLISIASSVTKHSPLCKLTVRHQNSQKSGLLDWETSEISSPFTRWFSADGHFIAKPFQEWLATAIPVVGQAAQKNTPRDNRLAENPASKEVLDSSDFVTGAGAKSRRGKK